MALYSLNEAESYFEHNALPTEEWSNTLTDNQKNVALEIVDRRFAALPWRAEYQDPAVRKTSAAIEAAWFSYLAQLTIKFCPREMPAPAVKPDNSNLVSVLADMPRDVAARLLPFLNASYLTPITQQATSDGRRARPMVEV